jgi:hypothetical protein
MSDHKKCEKTNINALVKWWMPSDLLQMECNWNEKLCFPCNNENEIYQLVDGLFEEMFLTLKL